MLLRLPNGESFATGAIDYTYTPATEREDTPRITIDVAIGNLRTQAFVDTGGVYLICSPRIAWGLNLSPADALQASQLVLRGTTVHGMLYRVPLTLFATQGNAITIDATAFVPDSSIEWSDIPCILGMYLCLERLRFAVDPLNEVFYFGELS